MNTEKLFSSFPGLLHQLHHLHLRVLHRNLHLELLQEEQGRGMNDNNSRKKSCIQKLIRWFKNFKDLGSAETRGHDRGAVGEDDWEAPKVTKQSNKYLFPNYVFIFFYFFQGHFPGVERHGHGPCSLKKIGFIFVSILCYSVDVFAFFSRERKKRRKR